MCGPYGEREIMFTRQHYKAFADGIRDLLDRDDKYQEHKELLIRFCAYVFDSTERETFNLERFRDTVER